jgi:acetylornithine deacetylase/succinyl-diaminopimelate desuccinylase-like protein
MLDLSKPIEEIAADIIAIESVSENEKKLCDKIEQTLKKLNFTDYIMIM